jgi:hypothetical protein
MTPWGFLPTCTSASAMDAFIATSSAYGESVWELSTSKGNSFQTVPEIGASVASIFVGV